MIRNGNVELQAREEELRFMRMQINEEKRTVTVLHGQTPNKMSLEQELVTLQIQVLDDTQSNTHHIHTCTLKPMIFTQFTHLWSNYFSLKIRGS